jgi:hypothetical protein
MQVEEIFQENLELLLEKQPNFWLLQAQLLESRLKEWEEKPEGLREFSTAAVSSSWGKTLFSWRKTLDLSSVEVLCVYGLGQGEAFYAFEKWLEEERESFIGESPRERELVIVEDAVEEISLFLQNPLAKKVLTHKRVHLYLQQKTTIGEIAQKFPLSRMEVFLLPHEKKKQRSFSLFRLKLLQEITKKSALHADKLLFHRHFANFFPNWHKTKEAFYSSRLQGKFSNIPAIICGAGPSLFQEREVFSSLENKALVFAGGSALTALSSQGIFPHIGVVLDPNEEEFFRLKDSFCFEMPLFYANRVHKEIFSACNGPFGFMRTSSGSLTDFWMEEECGLKEPILGSDLDNNALSVVSMMASLAIFLGCSPIVFCGVDLAYTEDRCYAEGVIQNNQELFQKMRENTLAGEKCIKRKNQKGEMTTTAVKWLMESRGLKKLIQRHKDVQFFNAAEKGLKIEGAKKTSLKSQERAFDVQKDLRGMVLAEISQSQFPEGFFQKVDDNFEILHKSFLRCQKYVEKILQEAKEKKSFTTGASILAEIELKEEVAFLYVFRELETVLDNLLEKKHEKNDFSYLLEKWVYIQEALTKYLEVFSS